MSSLAKVLFSLSLAAIAGTLYFAKKSRDLDAARSTLQAEVVTTSALPPKAAHPTPKSMTPSAAPKAAGQAASSLAESPAERAQRMAKASKFPMGAEARSVIFRPRLRLRYAPVYNKLGLSKSQIDAFENAAAGIFVSIDLSSVVPGIGQDPDTEYTIQLSRLDKVVRETLGHSAVEHFREHASRIDLNAMLDRVELQSFGSQTLGPEQREKLLTACIEAKTGGSDVRLNPGDIDWQRVLDASAGFLSPEQRSALQNALDLRELDGEYFRITGFKNRKLLRGM